MARDFEQVVVEDLSPAIDMEGLLWEFINVHFVKNFLFVGRVAREWTAFKKLSRSQREMSPLKEEDDYAFLGEADQKGRLHTQTPVLSSQVKQFFASADFQEFAQFSFTSYGNVPESFPKFEQLEKLLRFPYINSEAFVRSDLQNVVKSLASILPGNNFFWRVAMRFLLETSQTFFVQLQISALKEKKQGFKDCLELFNKLVVRDFLERYLGKVGQQKDFGFRKVFEQATPFKTAQPHDLTRSPLLGSWFNQSEGNKCITVEFGNLPNSAEHKQQSIRKVADGETVRVDQRPPLVPGKGALMRLFLK